MGMLNAWLFSWLQEADFYIAMHAEAMKEIPVGEERTWVDIGCGPGLLTRLAAAKGYNATGIDRDPAMIRQARHLAGHDTKIPTFMSGEISSVPAGEADVVSASSLLAVLDDRTGGLDQLLALVKPGGMLILIEATEKMNLQTAWSLVNEGHMGRRGEALLLWALARQGNTVPAELFTSRKQVALTFRPLLHELAGVWILRKEDVHHP